MCSGHPALRDVDVRQALAKAIDKQQLIDVATLGTASWGVSLVPPGWATSSSEPMPTGSSTSTPPTSSSTTPATPDTNGDGIRECLPDQDCEDLTFRFYYPDDIDTAPREADLIHSMWQAVGVDLTIQSFDSDTLTSICCPAFDYDVMLWHWGSDPDPQFLLGVPTCDAIETGYNETGYCDADYDELYNQQAVEVDHATRVDIIHEMQRKLLEDVPYIIPYYQATVQAYRTDRFTGWHEGPSGFGLEDPSSLNVIQPVAVASSAPRHRDGARDGSLAVHRAAGRVGRRHGAGRHHLQLLPVPGPAR